MDILDNVKEMDALYGRLENLVDTESQTEIFDFLRTTQTYDGSEKGGEALFKLRTIPRTPNWDWREQERFAGFVADEKVRRREIGRATSEKTLRKLSTQALTSETKQLAEDKLLDIGVVRSQTFFNLIQTARTPSEIDTIIRRVEDSELPFQAQEKIISGAEFKREIIMEV